MTLPAIIEVEAQETHLTIVPKLITDQSANLSDGWVIFTPIAGIAVGTAVHEFGIFGLGAAVAAGLIVAAGTKECKHVVAAADRRSARFSAKPRPALPAGTDG